MNDTDVQEHAGDEPPPIAGQREPGGVRSPAQEFLRSGIGDRNPSQGHANKDCNVDSKDRLGNGGDPTPADPGRRHDLLDCVFTDFAAPGGFVLHAPLANPLTEGKCRERAPALDALRHVFSWKGSAVSHAPGELMKRKVMAPKPEAWSLH